MEKTLQDFDTDWDTGDKKFEFNFETHEKTCQKS